MDEKNTVTLQRLVELAKVLKNQIESHKTIKKKQDQFISDLQCNAEEKDLQLKSLNNYLQDRKLFEKKLTSFEESLHRVNQHIQSIESGSSYKAHQKVDEKEAQINNLISQNDRFSKLYHESSQETQVIRKELFSFKEENSKLKIQIKETKLKLDSFQKDHKKLMHFKEDCDCLNESLSLKENLIASLQEQEQENRSSVQKMEKREKENLEYIKLLEAKLQTATINCESQINHKQEIRALSQEKSDIALKQANDWEIKFFQIQDAYAEIVKEKQSLIEELQSLKAESEDLTNFILNIKKVLGKKIQLSDIPTPTIEKKPTYKKTEKLIELRTSRKTHSEQLDLFSLTINA